MNHQILYSISALVGLIVIIVGIASVVLPAIKKKLPYEKKPFLLTIPERKFYETLLEVLPTGYTVFPQIVISSIAKTTSNNNFWFYQNKINKKVLDFVIFKKPYFQPVLAIEYDDKTHLMTDRNKRDEFVNRVLETSGIQILHIKYRNEFDISKVKELLITKLKESDI